MGRAILQREPSAAEQVLRTLVLSYVLLLCTDVLDVNRNQTGHKQLTYVGSRILQENLVTVSLSFHFCYDFSGFACGVVKHLPSLAS